ncbi:MAG: glucosaminidase domain-containing protein [Sphingomonadales bacterium]|nr:glucosaminidase domain-containing protein [Sphingomonadales bacterium]
MSRSTLIVVGLVVVALVLTGGTVAVVVFKDRADFVRRLWAALDAFRDRSGQPLPLSARWILLAQAAYETEWGRTAAARGHNYWNLSAGSSWKGPVTPGPDTEPDGQGGWKNILQAWRAYPDDQAGISDLVDNWLTWPAYRAAKPKLLAGDRDGYLSELRAGGYFTQDLPTYQAGVLARLEQSRPFIV